MTARYWTLSLCVASIFSLVSPVYAGDIGSDISRGQFTGEGGYFELGGTVYAGNNAVVGVPDDGDTVTGATVAVSGRWQQGPAFIEYTTLDTVNVGINLLHTQRWWVDALISQRHGNFDPQKIDALENSNLRKRSADVPVGLRATGYLGATLVQITVLSGDLRDNHNGYAVAAELGHTWQIRNYNLHWLLGAIFESDDVTHYYFGIDNTQADAQFPAYQASDSLRLVAELGVTLALNENWVLRGQARYAQLSNSIQDSPIIEDDHTTLAALTLSYVF